VSTQQDCGTTGPASSWPAAILIPAGWNSCRAPRGSSRRHRILADDTGAALHPVRDSPIPIGCTAAETAAATASGIGVRRAQATSVCVGRALGIWSINRRMSPRGCRRPLGETPAAGRSRCRCLDLAGGRCHLRQDKTFRHRAPGRGVV